MLDTVLSRAPTFSWPVAHIGQSIFHFGKHYHLCLRNTLRKDKISTMDSSRKNFRFPQCPHLLQAFSSSTKTPDVFSQTEQRGMLSSSWLLNIERLVVILE